MTKLRLAAAALLAGFALTPSAFAVAPLATEAKKPMVVMNAATSAITTKSPFIVRTSHTLPQKVEIKVGGFKANRLHFLSGAAGWGAKGPSAGDDLVRRPRDGGAIAELRAEHARFHQHAARIVQMAKDGRVAAAQRALEGEYEAISGELIRQLQAWRP